MKIMFNTGTLKKGGAERVITNLCNYLVKENQIMIVTTVKSSSYYELDNNIKLASLDIDTKINRNKIIRNIKRTLRLKKIIEEEKPDIIVSFLPEPSYRVLFLKLFNKKIRIIISVRNDPKIEYNNELNKIIMKKLYPLANGFVFQTKEAKEYFNMNIQNKSVVIPNPLAEEFVNTKINSQKTKEIVNVGRLEKQKNQEMLIRAFEIFSNKHKEYKLIIYGEGSERDKLEKLVAELNLGGRVLLPGNVDNIVEKLNKAEIFVLSSEYEGMPNALMEAMAMGLVCISTDCPCGGPRFLIENEKNGFLISNKIEDLIEKLEYIIENTEKKKSISIAALKIRSELAPKVINEKWYKYILENIKGNLNEKI